jgi:hypothetical protein
VKLTSHDCVVLKLKLYGSYFTSPYVFLPWCLSTGAALAFY